jgi:hypothetical protein
VDLSNKNIFDHRSSFCRAERKAQSKKRLAAKKHKKKVSRKKTQKNTEKEKVHQGHEDTEGTGLKKIRVIRGKK